MENNLNNEKNFDKTHKDPRQGNPQEDQKKQQEKAMDEKEDKEKNKNWDQVQRRSQAAPRSYNESLESENIENQNTLADKEQIDNADEESVNRTDEGFESGRKIGDKISERQQTMDENKSPGEKKNR